MAVWTASRTNWTPVAVADTTNFTDNGYFAVQGGSSTQRNNILKVKVGGLAGTSAPAQMMLARDSTIGASSLSGGLLAAQDPATAALAAPPVVFSVSTTKPQRSSTLQLLAMGFNAFGGIYQNEWNPDKPLSMLGNTASFGELSLSHLANGTPGLCDAFLFVEPL